MQPSKADITFTNDTCVLAKTLDFGLLDHLIIDDNAMTYFSFLEEGFL
jgi:DNA repair protein RadC